MRIALAAAVVLLMISGCTHAVSSRWREAAAADLSVEDLFRSPGGHIGAAVILGGVIAKVRNLEDTTSIEVVEKPLDWRGRPVVSDVTRGRFRVVHDGFLDPYIYREGRGVTVAGTVEGSEQDMLGEVPYTFPVVRSGELSLHDPTAGFPIHFGIGIGIGGSF